MRAMTLPKTDAVRLAVLEAIEWGPRTASSIEQELRDRLPAAGVAPEHQVGRVLVNTALKELRRAELVAVDVRRGSEKLWTITDEGLASIVGSSARARW